MENTQKKVSALLKDLKRASKQLSAGLTRAEKTKDDLDRDGVIQRFEYTFELSWKATQKFLNLLGIHVNSPREVLRKAFKEELFEDGEQWLAYLEARNLVAHTYKEDTAQKVFTQAKAFSKDTEKLIKALEKRIQEMETS